MSLGSTLRSARGKKRDVVLGSVKELAMVKVSRPTVSVSGSARPERVYVAVQTGTGMRASSDRITVNMPGERPKVVEVRENTAGTAQNAGSGFWSHSY